MHFEGYHETQGTSVVVECGKGADRPGGQGKRAVYLEEHAHLEGGVSCPDGDHTRSACPEGQGVRNAHSESYGLKVCLEASYLDGQCWFPEGDHMRVALLENGMKAEAKAGWRPYLDRAAWPEPFCPDQFPKGKHMRAALPESKEMKAACPEGYGWRPCPERAACPEASYSYGNGWRAFFSEGDHVRSARLEGQGVRNVVEWCAQ